MNSKKHLNEPLNELKGLSIPWEKSKEEVWAELTVHLEEPKIKVVKWPQSSGIRWAAAAILVTLLASGLFFRFYSKNITCLAGEYISHDLPDGSLVNLNALSKVSYHPLWWRFDRRIKLEGEGYFDVEPGKKFNVISEKAATSVLGTTFTIYARDERYRVTCHSGSVRVTATGQTDQQILGPHQQVKLSDDGKLKFLVVENDKDLPAWYDAVFEYAGYPLDEVFEEMERQYSIEIIYPEENEHIYTGSFSTHRDLETSLDLVCKPFRLNFEKISTGVYRIISDQ